MSDSDEEDYEYEYSDVDGDTGEEGVESTDGSSPIPSPIRSIRPCWPASVIAIDDGPRDYFVYHGRETIPHEVTRVILDSSVGAIRDYALLYRRSLIVVNLNEELEEIGVQAFMGCEFLQGIRIPHAVRKIKNGAFANCRGLTDVTLGNGLEEIEQYAFYECILMHEIAIPNAVRMIQRGAFSHCRNLSAVTFGVRLEEIGENAFTHCAGLQTILIPNAVKAIKAGAFQHCKRLTTVTLGSGLEEIGYEAFGNCTSLTHILIPPTVKRIDYTAFRGCSRLMSVKFCDELEKFVSSWWNRRVGFGDHFGWFGFGGERCMRAFSFLVRCGILARFSGLAKITSSQANIHAMLMSIPTITTRGMNAYFDSIDSKITFYETVLDEAPVLFSENFGLDYGIVLNILSFM
jgi:hypothetical protein